MTARRAKPRPVTARDVAAVVVRLVGEVHGLKRRLARMEGRKRRIGFQLVNVQGEVIDKDEPDEDEFDGGR